MSKFKKMQVFRVIIQILMLLLLPGLFIMAFNELKEIVKMVLSGNFNFTQALPSLLEFIVVTVLTIIAGRFFCGWLCAFGTYSDLIYLISKRVFKINFKINENIDSYLKYIKYVILLAILLASCIFGSTVLSSVSPWDAFAQITNLSSIIINLPVGLLILLLITIGTIFVERFFCKYLCPLGAFFSLISKVSFLKIKKPSDKCGMCRACTNNCSMGLKLYKTENIRGGDCINCFKCTDVCPRKNACINAFGQDMNTVTASSMAIAAFIGVYGITNLGGFAADKINLNSSENNTLGAINTSGAANPSGSTEGKVEDKSPSWNTDKSSKTDSSKNDSSSGTQGATLSPGTSTQQGKYKDGTYTGTGIGFRGGTTEISVTISGGRITAIETISSEDTPRFYNYCEETVINNMLSSQSSSVDTVSGATYSSKGIIQAVNDALSKAV